MLNNNLKHKGYQIDLSKKGNVKNLYKKIKKDYSSIDILVNNIGHTLEVKDPFSKVENWKSNEIKFFDIGRNSKLFISGMKKLEQIINITSVAGGNKWSISL